MQTVNDLKTNSNPDFVASELFDLVLKKDDNILQKIYDFDDDITFSIYQKITGLHKYKNDANTLLQKKEELTSLYEKTLYLHSMYNLLDKKICDYLQQHATTSKDDYGYLTNGVLFAARTKSAEMEICREDYEKYLANTAKMQEKSSQITKNDTPSIVDKIKAIRDKFIHKNDAHDKPDNRPK